MRPFMEKKRTEPLRGAENHSGRSETDLLPRRLIHLIHSGRVFHCVFPTATGFALGPRLLALRVDGYDFLFLEGGSEQGWAWRDMPQMAASLKD